MKLALAMHFAENNDFVISLDTAERALSMLNNLELSMHQALAFSGRNPLGLLYKRVWKWLAKEGPKTMMEIWEKFINDMTIQEVEQCVEFLEITGKLEKPTIENKTMQYKVKEGIKYE